MAAALAHHAPGHNERRTLALLDALAAGRLAIDPHAPGMVDLAYVPPAGAPAPDPAAVAAGAAPVDAGTRAGPGHYYAGGAPGLAFTLLPAHVVGRALLPEAGLRLALTILGAGLPLAVAAVAVRRAALATGAAPDAATLTAAAFGVGTIALPFAARLYAHALVVALLAGALALLLPRGPGRGRFAAAGALAGWAVACDYSAGLQAAGLLALAALRGGVRGAGAFCLGGLPFAALVGAYHAACFGAPWRTPYDHHADQTTRTIVADGAWGFTVPRPDVLLALLLGERRGLLVTQPAALVGLAGLVAATRRRSAPHAVALGVAALTLLANAARHDDWAAGQSFGARYAAAALPFLALGLPAGLALLGRLGPWVIGASVACAGLGATSEWGRDVWTTFDAAWWLGLRARGLELVILGPAPHPLAAALLGGVAVTVLAALALRALAPAAPRRAYAVALALPLLVGGHAALQLARVGPDALRRRVIVRQLARAIEAAGSLEELRRLDLQRRHAGLDDEALERRVARRAGELAR
ncbi:MAG: hypothetical protein M9894_24215 [Planctomycetes bacterium]|nr:hypothetical protein [Planctomycetota bacterium]